MLVTKNVINRLAIQFMMKELNLRDRCTVVLNLEEAQSKIGEMQNDLTCTEGFAMLLLDIEDLKRKSCKKMVQSFKDYLGNKQVSYMPKIVYLSNSQAIKNKSKLSSLGIDYQLSKPI